MGRFFFSSVLSKVCILDANQLIYLTFHSKRSTTNTKNTRVEKSLIMCRHFFKTCLQFNQLMYIIWFHGEIKLSVVYIAIKMYPVFGNNTVQGIDPSMDACRPLINLCLQGRLPIYMHKFKYIKQICFQLLQSNAFNNNDVY